MLRLEVRLGNRKKIKDVLDKVGSDTNLTFEALFNESLARSVLLQFWGILTPDIDMVACSGFPAGELFDAIYSSAPEQKPSQILQLTGALAIIQKDGMEGLRTRFERNATPHSWYGLRKKLNGLSVSSHMKYNPVRVATQHLDAFLPLKLSDYKKE